MTIKISALWYLTHKQSAKFKTELIEKILIALNLQHEKNIARIRWQPFF
jgi:hypothetical protein